MAQTDHETIRKLAPSWHLVQKNFELLKGRSEQIIIIALLPVLTVALGDILMQTNQSLGSIVFIIGMIWYFTNLAASYSLQLSSARGKIIPTADLYAKNWRYSRRLILFSLLFSVMTFIGFLLLIVPGLMILRRYFLAGYYIVDQDLTIKQAMKLSADQSKPVASYVWGTIVVILVLVIVGSLVSLLFISIPGVSTVLSSLLVLTYLFVPAQRYLEIAEK